jgi:hypothetical protein
MRTPHATHLVLGPVLCGVLATASPAQTQDSLTARLPRATVAVVEFEDGVAWARRLIALLETMPDPPQRLQGVRTLLPTLVRAATGGVALDDALAALAPKRVVLALVSSGALPEPLLIAETDDASGARTLRSSLLGRLGARAFVDDGDGRLIVAANLATLELARRAYDGVEPRLALEGFCTHAPRSAASLVVHVDLAAVRAKDLDRRSYGERLDPGGRLLFGPLTAALDRARAVHVELEVLPRGAELAMTIDGSPLAGDPAQDDEAALLLASPRRARSLPPAPAGTLATLALDRSLAAPFVHVRKLFGAAAEAQLLGGLSIADALLRASFVNELLPCFRGSATLFVVAPAQGGEAPAAAAGLLLPGFALVLPLKDSVRAAELALRGLSTFALAANVERMRQEKLPYAMRVQRDDEGRPGIVFEPSEWHGAAPAPLDATFQPTLLFGATQLVVASTRETALATMAALAGTADEVTVQGDLLSLDPAGLAEYLVLNRELAVLDTVLKRGVPARQARRELDELAQVLRNLQPFDLRLEPVAGSTTLRTELAWREARGTEAGR